MSQDAYRGRVTDKGYLVVTPPPTRDPAELSAYGGSKSRYGGEWLLPLRGADLDLMAEDGILVQLDPATEERLRRERRLSEYLQRAEDLERRAEHPYWDTLMPHQRVGVGFLSSRKTALLSFSPGLGKSATAVVAADVLGLQRVLVVAPLTLLPTWRREIAMWSSDPDTFVVGKKWDLSHRWSVVNVDKLLTKAGKVLYEQDWDLIVYDESILYKNGTAKRSKAAKELAERSTYVWLLSGSPIAHYADDLFSQLRILRPDVFRSFKRFRDQWCIVRPSPWTQMGEVVGNRDPQRLRRYLSDTMLSKTPDDLPGLLPETLVEVVDVELTRTQEKLLAQMESEMVWDDDDGERHDITAVIAQLTRMSQAVSCPYNVGVEDNGPGAKVEAVAKLLSDEVLRTPLLAWVHYRQTGEALVEALEGQGYKVGLIHGGVPSWEREDLLRRYQEKDLDVLVMQLQTGKFGLSLTETGSMVYVDRSFSYDDWVQSIARIRRLSSKGRVVPTYVLHGGWTDNLVDVILNRKLKSARDLSLSDLQAVLRKGRERRVAR